MKNAGFSSWPSYSEEEITAVADVLRSNRVNYWTGNQTKTFEKEFASAMNVKHAIAVANGTVAIDLALKFTMNPGDEIIVTSRTFIASVSSIVEAGCIPVFADVDRDSQNISATTIEQVLTKKTKAILVVHLAGMPADMDPILEIAATHNLIVIEDCAQAHGAHYKGRSVGSFGDVGAWSFCQDKIMTTGGEGGMVTVNSDELWSLMWSYKDHGKSWEAVHKKNHPSGFRWLHESFGTNWRMTEMQSAIGRIQLKHLPSWQAKRWWNASQIWSTCEKFDWLRVPSIPEYIAHASYKAYVFVEPSELPLGWSRDRIVQEIEAFQVPIYSGSCSEVYLEKAFDNTNFRPAIRLPVARELGMQSLMFLCHPTLTKDEIKKTCNAIEHVNAQIEMDRIVKKASVAR